MKRIYHLSNCSTCKRVIHDLRLKELGFEFVDIKEKPITTNELEDMKSLAGSYEKIFSKRAMKYRQLGLHEKTLSEDEMKKFILEEYTFITRPVIIIDDAIFVGSSKKTIEAARNKLK